MLDKGFTLIELLVVIAIIAILAVVVVLTLNPAQLLAQSRDANRLSDLATLNSAINLYTTDQGGASNFSLGTSSVTYVSIPDPNATSTAGTDCSLMSGNFLAGGSFHCAASSTYRNASTTGWLPINFNSISAGSPFGSLPVDPVNSTSSNLYYTYESFGSTFRVTAVPESQKYQTMLVQNPLAFTVGSAANLTGTWVPVPGNSQFGTGNFMVMKYDASCETTGGTPLTSPLDGTAVNGYNNSSQNCSIANGYIPVSIAAGYPIVDVSQNQAASYCASIGAHLMTNNEWQTIAWNTEGQGSNWYGGTVGTNYVYSGHNDNIPANASLPSANDSQSCVGTDGPSSCGGTGTNISQIRTLTLSNGSVVWDMAGNLWQWTSDTIQGQNEPYGGSPGFTWRQYTAITNWGTMTQQTAGPLNNAWSSTQGIGEIYSDGTSGNTTVYGFIRGGNWSYGAVAGVGALYLSGSPGSTYGTLGFRCAR